MMTDTSNKFWHELVKLVPFSEQKLANNIYDKNVSLQPNSLFTEPQVIGAKLCLLSGTILGRINARYAYGCFSSHFPFYLENPVFPEIVLEIL